MRPRRAVCIASRGICAARVRRWRRRSRWVSGGGRGGRGRRRRRGRRSGGGGDEEAPAFFGRGGGGGALVVPGKYTVSLAKRIDGVITPLGVQQTFEVVPEGPASREDRAALAEFSEKVARLQKALSATQQSATEARTKIEAIRRAIDATPSLPLKLREQALAMERSLAEINRVLNGDRVMAGVERRHARVHLRPRASRRRAPPRHDRQADQDRPGAVSDRVRPAGGRDPEAPQTPGDGHQGDREATRRGGRSAHSGAAAGMERRKKAGRLSQLCTSSAVLPPLAAEPGNQARAFTGCQRPEGTRARPTCCILHVLKRAPV